ncbi:uncharacterized protein LOC141685659 [Apium graveolens]|uniref:uncharacterized protein LOC141685659 n=1 Tax=Apium graveolens TaxID=4045 RepID=UPI003D7A1E89
MGSGRIGRMGLDQLMIDYFFQIFSASNTHWEEILNNVQRTISVQVDEVKYVISQMNPDKAPGLMFGNNLNATNIILIPKKKVPINMGDLRPIALCNVTYKLISKVLANRMKPILNLVVSPNQSAFIPGRLITDNIMVSFEVVHYLKRKKVGKDGYMAIKLDMSKAYDRVEWYFVEAIMRKMGFDAKWVRLVMHCMTSHTISLGGKTWVLFFQQEVANGAPSISHMYADDSYLYCKATITEAIKVCQLLHTFETASGQQVNRQKSSIFFSKNTSDMTRMEEIHWASWDKLCKPKNVGGMGFRKLNDFNLALLGKQAWRLLNNEESLVARVLKVRYFLSALCWMQDAACPFVTNQHPSLQNQLVSSLMKTWAREWDSEVIVDLFNDRDQLLILGTPLSHFQEDDIRYWYKEDNGAYTTLGLGDTGIASANFADWLEQVMGQGSIGMISKMGMILWSIWNARNSVVWHSTYIHVDEVIRTARQTIKINVDAALFDNEGRYGYACVARDHTGRLVNARAGCRRCRITPVLAEGIAFKEAFSWIKTTAWQSVVLETDCIKIVQSLRSSLSINSPFDLVISDCKQLLHEIGDAAFFYVKRSANGVAHYLARQSLFFSDRVFTENDAPLEVLSLCMSESLND